MTSTETKKDWFSPTFRWLVWSVYLAAWSAALLTPRPGHLVRAFIPGFEITHFAQKALHVGAYAGLAVLTGWLGAPQRARWLLIALIFFHAFGTEYLQLFVPGRSGELTDVGFNQIGLGLGLLVSCTWWWRD